MRGSRPATCSSPPRGPRPTVAVSPPNVWAHSSRPLQIQAGCRGATRPHRSSPACLPARRGTSPSTLCLSGGLCPAVETRVTAEATPALEPLPQGHGRVPRAHAAGRAGRQLLPLAEGCERGPPRSAEILHDRRQRPAHRRPGPRHWVHRSSRAWTLTPSWAASCHSGGIGQKSPGDLEPRPAHALLPTHAERPCSYPAPGSVRAADQRVGGAEGARVHDMGPR